MTSVSVTSPKFWNVFLPAMMIVAGVNLKNGSNQFSKSNGMPVNNSVMIAGAALFVIGWVGVAYNLSSNGGRKSARSTYIMLSSAAIVASVMIMKGAKYIVKSPPKWHKTLMVVFVLAWLGLAYAVGMGKSQTAKQLAWGSAILVIASMAAILPWQRANVVVDGPGFVMFGLAWVALAAANALK